MILSSPSLHVLSSLSQHPRAVLFLFLHPPFLSFVFSATMHVYNFIPLPLPPSLSLSLSLFFLFLSPSPLSLSLLSLSLSLSLSVFLSLAGSQPSFPWSLPSSHLIFPFLSPLSLSLPFFLSPSLCCVILSLCHLFSLQFPPNCLSPHPSFSVSQNSPLYFDSS